MMAFTNPIKNTLTYLEKTKKQVASFQQPNKRSTSWYVVP